MSKIFSFSRQEIKIQTKAHKTAGDGAQFCGQTEQVAPFATAAAGSTKSSAGTRGTRKYPGEEGLKSATEHKTKHRAQNVKHGRQSFLRPAVTTFKVRLRGGQSTQSEIFLRARGVVLTQSQAVGWNTNRYRRTEMARFSPKHWRGNSLDGCLRGLP